MAASYYPAHPLLRSVFAGAALAATIACGAFIDSLASNYSAAGLHAQKAQSLTVAAAGASVPSRAAK